MRFFKGHGTENDFILVPDADGALGPLPPELVKAICDRRAGVGADGVIRVVRTTATDDPAAAQARDDAEWFMDYRNSDGSLSEMCGNGVRVLARYLVECEGADKSSLPIATRAGVKVLTFDGDDVTVDMGTPRVVGTTWVSVGERTWDATHVDMGNPHAVVFVDDLADAGDLLDEPGYDLAAFPLGVYVEFVVRRGPGRLAMRVHERGSGETRSCGTGACAVAVAAGVKDVEAGGSPHDRAYAVEPPGGRLRVDWTPDDRVLLTGPAVLVAEGNWLAGRWTG